MYLSSPCLRIGNDLRSRDNVEFDVLEMSIKPALLLLLTPTPGLSVVSLSDFA